MAADQKQPLRTACLRRLAALAEEGRRAESEAIASALIAHPRFRAARIVYAYAPLRTEPDWMAAWDAERLWAFPRCEGGDLRFYIVANRGDLSRGNYGILEPAAGRPAPAPDLILVPGLAFDHSGGRLGRGRGYYDRFLIGCAGYRLGLAFRCQFVGGVPVEPCDVPMDGVLTADGWEDAGGGRWTARSEEGCRETPRPDPGDPQGI